MHPYPPGFGHTRHISYIRADGRAVMTGSHPRPPAPRGPQRGICVSIRRRRGHFNRPPVVRMTAGPAELVRFRQRRRPRARGPQRRISESPRIAPPVPRGAPRQPGASLDLVRIGQLKPASRSPPPPCGAGGERCEFQTVAREQIIFLIAVFDGIVKPILSRPAPSSQVGVCEGGARRS